MKCFLVMLVLMPVIQRSAAAPSRALHAVNLQSELDDKFDLIRRERALSLDDVATWARQGTLIGLFNVAYNEFVFISDDTINGDNIVETHPDTSDKRSRFRLIPCNNGGYMLYNPHYQKYLFVSNDKRGSPPDNVVQAHSTANDDRNCFTIQFSGDSYINLYSQHYGKSWFVSNNVENDDNIVEAHADKQHRNNFLPFPYLS